VLQGSSVVRRRGQGGETGSGANGDTAHGECEPQDASVRVRSRGAWPRGARPREGAAARGRATSRRGARSSQKLFQLRPLQVRFSLKFGTEVHKVVNRKVVDLTTLCDFYKGFMVFFLTVFA
jgi:hypothetical protein